jgi:hypothetical protein
MENLPIELLIYIFNYVPNHIISISQVCRYFNSIATEQIRKTAINFHRESEKHIDNVSKHLEAFKGLKSLDVTLGFDVNIAEKADFCAIHSNKITHLILSDFSFLNPFFDKLNVNYSNLNTLIIENSDLTSSSDDLPNFILKSCSNLKSLKISGCSGLEIDSLNAIGQNLCNTKIEKLELHPTYSYFDMSTQNNRDESWTIENLNTLSVRSKLVVMKKNFVRNMLGNKRKFPNMRKLELIAELNFGNNFISVLTQQFPNLECLSIGKGVMDVHNQDFTTICNQYKSLRALEFHFIHQDEPLDLRYLQINQCITKLTIGLTKDISHDDLQKISKNLPNLTHLSVILYYLISSNKDYLEQLIKTFSNVKQICFSHIGMLEKIKIML